MEQHIPLGTRVDPWGVISAVHSGGERYYMFAEKGVALIPAYVVESAYAQQQRSNAAPSRELQSVEAGAVTPRATSGTAGNGAAPTDIGDDAK